MIFNPGSSNSLPVTLRRHFLFNKNMADAGPPAMVHSLHSNIVIKEEPEAEECALFTSEDAITKRDPVVNLLSPVSGLQPLVWSEDHRLAACTSGSLSVMELICDVNNNKQDLTLHRTSIAVPTDTYRFQVDFHEYISRLNINLRSMLACCTVSVVNRLTKLPFT